MLILKHFGLQEKEIASLDDETFFDTVAKAYFFEKRMAETIKEGLLLAIADVMKSV